MASKAKKKVSEASSKKERKKDKKKGKEPSITDVIAVELMEKAKKTLGNEPSVKKEGRTPSPPPAPSINKEPEPPTPPRINSHPHSDSEKEPEDDEFNIPTISEIKTTAGTQSLHKKELSQLQELQNRIYQTKRKLYDLSSESEEETPVTRNSVMSRLGVKPTENSKPSNIISLSAIRRTEKEVYVPPNFRKLIERQKVENDRRDVGREEGPRRTRAAMRSDRRSRSGSRSRDRLRNRRERSRSPFRRSRSPKTRPSILQRIGSRVVVAASPEKEAPVKVKQRPVLSSAITAGKNLLLRAVAEAQRSTAFVEKRNRKPRDNIVVQVPIRKDKRNIRLDEEYVPESISTQSESEAEYRPSKNTSQDDGDDGDVIYLNNNEEVDLEELENDETQKSPQFVVTLEGVTQFDNRSKSSHSPTPPPVIKRKSIKDRIGLRPTAVREERQPVKRKVEEESESQRAYNRAKRARLSPIKFDLTDEEEEDGERKSRNSSRDRRSETTEKDQNENKGEQNGDEHAKRIKLEPSRSFDHVPACKIIINVLCRKKLNLLSFSAQLGCCSCSRHNKAYC